MTARVTSIHAIFQLTVRRIWMFFSLKPSPSQGNHPSKFQFAGVHRFGGVREQTNKQTHSLTDWRFYRVIGTVLRLTSELYPNIGQNRKLYFSIYQLIISTAPSLLFVFILAQEHIDLVYKNQM